jgi:hypothetical protein
VRRQRVVGGQLGRDMAGQAGREPPGHVELGELVELVVGRGLEQHALGGELGRLPVVLGPQLRVLDRAHGQRPRHQPGEPGEHEHA